MQTGLASSVKDCPELRWRMADFRGVEADAENPVAIWQRLLERLHRGLGAQVPEEAGDQSARDLQPVAAVLQCPMDAADHGLEGNAPVGVGLRIEEYLGMADTLAGRAAQVGGGQLVKVLLLQQHLAARVIEVEERLKIAEDIGSSQ